jgi:hypothetical protein
VETFLGLLHLTFSALDAEHDLSNKFGFDGPEFLKLVAEKLGEKRPISDVLATCVGGALDVLRPEEAT